MNMTAVVNAEPLARDVQRPVMSEYLMKTLQMI